MALRRPSTDRHGGGASAAGTLLVAAIFAGCTLYGVDVRRDGNGMVTMSVNGHADPATRAWLCPRDPGPGETWGDEGARRLIAISCIDLGLSDPLPGATGWQTTFDVNDLPADRLAAFEPGGRYRLLLVAGDGEHVSTYSADIPPLSLAP